jgi:hypothetical protein
MDPKTIGDEPAFLIDFTCRAKDGCEKGGRRKSSLKIEDERGRSRIDLPYEEE